MIEGVDCKTKEGTYAKKIREYILGLAGFHMENVAILCLGKYLKVSGMREVLIRNNNFGPGTVDAACLVHIYDVAIRNGTCQIN